MNDTLKTGFNAHRLIPNDAYYAKEKAFVEVANREIATNGDFLSVIVNHSEHHWLEPHEEQIVLSVIQWLGTPVGQSFLSKVDTLIKAKENERNIQGQ